MPAHAALINIAANSMEKNSSGIRTVPRASRIHPSPIPIDPLVMTLIPRKQTPVIMGRSRSIETVPLYTVQIIPAAASMAASTSDISLFLISIQEFRPKKTSTQNSLTIPSHLPSFITILSDMTYVSLRSVSAVCQFQPHLLQHFIPEVSVSFTIRTVRFKPLHVSRL